jgi:hypothetical protein
MEDSSFRSLRQAAEKRAELLKKDCDFLSRSLSKEWDNMRDVDKLVVLRIMVDEKHCDVEQTLFFLIKLMVSPDSYYRYEALNYIAQIDGNNQRNFLIKVVLNDPDLGNRNRALLLLADIFHNQEDEEILRLALSVYDDSGSTTESRLIAGAAMMFQWGIAGGEDNRPAFWNEDEDELAHPLIQKAVTQTRNLLYQSD